MWNSVELDQNYNETIRAEKANRLGHLLSREACQSPRDHQIRAQEGLISRYQMMRQDTTDPLAVLLLQEIIANMEAELREQVNRLAAERYEQAVK
jgi:predicted component of type VI protein secretion system